MKSVISRGLPQLFDDKILAGRRSNFELHASCSLSISWRDQGGAFNWFYDALFEEYEESNNMNNTNLSNLKNWRCKVRPEHSIYTTLLGEKSLRVALLNRDKCCIWYIWKDDLWQIVKNRREECVKLYFHYGICKYYTSEELCISQNAGSSKMAKFKLS